MVFSSLVFLFRFLPCALGVYYLVPRHLKNTVLFFSSLIFYAWGEPVYVLLMLFSTVVDYVHGRLVHSFKRQGRLGRAKICVASSAVINLGLLAFFKYSGFFAENVDRLFGLQLNVPEVLLPLGISFYTFQTMSYTIDVYRGEAQIQRNIIDFGAYVAMFPQLIAGPIVRYKTIGYQLRERRESVDQFAVGIRRFVTGLGKKVLLANNIGLVWDQIQAMEAANASVLGQWVGIFAFAFQIYFDFSGYSDMAIGLGHMMGFTIDENFNYPYESKSITEFWRRWHISLGTWFKEYVYIPLGGNRKGIVRQIFNISLVWLLTGLWHGASWNFVLWGVYFGCLLIFEKLFLLKWLGHLPGWTSRIYALSAVLVGWVIFAFDSYEKGLGYLRGMVGLGGLALYNDASAYLLYTNGLLLAILMAGCTHWPKKLALRLLEHPFFQRTVPLAMAENLWLVGIFILCAAYLVDASYNPFLYFRF